MKRVPKKFMFNILVLIISSILALFLTKPIYAQNVSLSISPPIFELLIKQDKDVRQIFNISNNGSDLVITPKIYYSVPSDTKGNISISDQEAPSWIVYSKEPFSLKGGTSYDFEVNFRPDKDVPNSDHLLTLVFETKTPSNLIQENSTTHVAQIGANILLTVSSDGLIDKKVEILEFSFPKVVDSYSLFNLFKKESSLKYNIKLKNTGGSFVKPIGKIKFEGNGIDKALDLAPFNVLSGYSRDIKCLEGESVVDCSINQNFLIGKYKSKLEFKLDDQDEVYKDEIETYFLPISSTIFLIAFLVLVKVYRNYKRKR